MKAVTLIRMLAAQIEKHGDIDIDVCDETGLPFPAVGFCQRMDEEGSKVVAINLVNEYHPTCDFVVKPENV